MQMIVYLNIPQYPLAASNVCSGGTTRSNNRGNCDRHPMAANKFGSPGPTGSGNSRDDNTEPDTDSRNCGLVDMSYSEYIFGVELFALNLYNYSNTYSYTMLTCGRIHTIGLRLDKVFGFGGKSVSSCKPPGPRVKTPLHDRPFGSVPLETASLDRGLQIEITKIREIKQFCYEKKIGFSYTWITWTNDLVHLNVCAGHR